MTAFSSHSRLFRFALITLALVSALLVGLATPALTHAQSVGPLHPALAPHAQSAPIENSIVPTLVQIILIVLVTEGLKSLLKAFTNGASALAGREAAIAYVVVGLVVYLLQTYLIPALPPNIAEAVGNVFMVLATLLAGSGLFSMTSAFRIQNK